MVFKLPKCNKKIVINHLETLNNSYGFFLNQVFLRYLTCKVSNSLSKQNLFLRYLIVIIIETNISNNNDNETSYKMFVETCQIYFLIKTKR